MSTSSFISNDKVNTDEFLPLAATAMVPSVPPVEIDGEQNRHAIDSTGDESDSAQLDDNTYDFINKSLEAAGLKVPGSFNLIFFSEHFVSSCVSTSKLLIAGLILCRQRPRYKYPRLYSL